MLFVYDFISVIFTYGFSRCAFFSVCVLLHEFRVGGKGFVRVFVIRSELCNVLYCLYADENGAKRKKMEYGWGRKFGALLSQHNIVNCN